MFLEELDQPLGKLPGAGPKTAEKLALAGVQGIRGLLAVLPRAYEDRTRLVPLATVAGPNPVRVVTVVEVLSHSFFGAKGNLKIRIRDGSAAASLVCFGRSFLARTLGVGSCFLLSGLFSLRYGEIQASSFETEPLPSAEASTWHEWIQKSGGPATLGLSDAPPLPVSRQFGQILPRYPLVGGVASAKVRSLAAKALDLYVRPLSDPLPPALLERHGLPGLVESLTELHRPQRLGRLGPARSRMAYQELFFLQLRLARQALLRRAASDHEGRGLSVGHRNDENLGPIIQSLGFSLTEDQNGVLDEILADLGQPAPMSRLLQGDVGSGKTVVAFLAAAAVARAGGQSVLMAPTELLARQHADSAHRLLAAQGFSVAFLAGGLSAQARKTLLNQLAAGGIDLLVGTHAVFTQDVVFRELRLSIVDEQHRFGVAQRTALLSKGSGVNLLLMTATPIPRTLALTVYGDLEVSTLRQKPAGRLPVETHLARLGNEEKVYRFVEEQLKKGRQAYFVYPKIDQNSDDEAETTEPDSLGSGGKSPRKKAAAASLKSAQEAFEHLRTVVYPEFEVALIHGQMKDAEKIGVMESFVEGRVQVLASTTVVEVGVDVANATCMVVEHAERFGLAALHQLRGRVGRSELQSYCFLVYREPLTEIGKERLRILKETNDGFRIAEKDLELRGPGDIQGMQQSGFLQLDFADIGRDMELMNQARQDAFDLLTADPKLELPEHQGIAAVLAVLEAEA